MVFLKLKLFIWIHTLTFYYLTIPPNFPTPQLKWQEMKTANSFSEYLQSWKKKFLSFINRKKYWIRILF